MSERTGASRGADEDVRCARARRLLECVVEPAVFGPGTPLAISAHHLRGEPISPAEALRRPYEPFAVGEAWGPRWDTTWFHLQGRIPAEWAGQDVVLRLEALRAGTTVPGGEFLIFSAEGEDLPSSRGTPPLSFAGDTPRPSLPGRSRRPVVPARPRSLTGSAAGGEEVDLHVEAAANPTTPEDRMVGFDWPELRPDPDGDPGFVLSRCELAVRRPEVRALAVDLRLAIGLAAQQDAGSAAGREAHAALAAACELIDTADVAGSADAARAALAPVLVRAGGRRRQRTPPRTAGGPGDRRRPRPHRHGLAVAAAGDHPQVRPHLRHRRRP